MAEKQENTCLCAKFAEPSANKELTINSFVKNTSWWFHQRLSNRDSTKLSISCPNLNEYEARCEDHAYVGGGNLFKFDLHEFDCLSEDSDNTFLSIESDAYEEDGTFDVEERKVNSNSEEVQDFGENFAQFGEEVCGNVESCVDQEVKTKNQLDGELRGSISAVDVPGPSNKNNDTDDQPNFHTPLGPTYEKGNELNTECQLESSIDSSLEDLMRNIDSLLRAREVVTETHEETSYNMNIVMEPKCEFATSQINKDVEEMSQTSQQAEERKSSSKNETNEICKENTDVPNTSTIKNVDILRSNDDTPKKYCVSSETKLSSSTETSPDENLSVDINTSADSIDTRSTRDIVLSIISSDSNEEVEPSESPANYPEEGHPNCTTHLPDSCSNNSTSNPENMPETTDQGVATCNKNIVMKPRFEFTTNQVNKDVEEITQNSQQEGEPNSSSKNETNEICKEDTNVENTGTIKNVDILRSNDDTPKKYCVSSEIKLSSSTETSPDEHLSVDINTSADSIDTRRTRDIVLSIISSNTNEEVQASKSPENYPEERSSEEISPNCTTHLPDSCSNNSTSNRENMPETTQQVVATETPFQDSSPRTSDAEQTKKDAEVAATCEILLPCAFEGVVNASDEKQEDVAPTEGENATVPIVEKREDHGIHDDERAGETDGLETGARDGTELDMNGNRGDKMEKTFSVYFSQVNGKEVPCVVIPSLYMVCVIPDRWGAGYEIEPREVLENLRPSSVAYSGGKVGQRCRDCKRNLSRDSDKIDNVGISDSEGKSKADNETVKTRSAAKQNKNGILNKSHLWDDFDGDGTVYEDKYILEAAQADWNINCGDEHERKENEEALRGLSSGCIYIGNVTDSDREGKSKTDNETVKTHSAATQNSHGSGTVYEDKTLPLEVYSDLDGDILRASQADWNIKLDDQCKYKKIEEAFRRLSLTPEEAGENLPKKRKLTSFDVSTGSSDYVLQHANDFDSECDVNDATAAPQGNSESSAPGRNTQRILITEAPKWKEGGEIFECLNTEAHLFCSEGTDVHEFKGTTPVSAVPHNDAVRHFSETKIDEFVRDRKTTDDREIVADSTWSAEKQNAEFRKTCHIFSNSVSPLQYITETGANLTTSYDEFNSSNACTNTTDITLPRKERDGSPAAKAVKKLPPRSSAQRRKPIKKTSRSETQLAG